MAFVFKTTLLAGAVSALAAISAAQAQDEGYNRAAYAPGDTEEVIVVAPRYHQDGGARLNGVPGHATLSLNVSYSDLDLATREGARELRGRVRDAAREVCEDLASDSPVAGQAINPCVRAALSDAMPRVNEAIADARY